MNRLLLGTASFVALVAAGSAQAAPPPVIYNWTGFYIGANIGWSFGHASTDWTIAGAPFGSTSQNMDGILGGLQAGYNRQSGNWVLGLEADIQATAQTGNSSLIDSIPAIPGIPCVNIDGPNTPCRPGTGTPGVPGVTGVANNEINLPWFGTFRGRLGFTPSDRWLVYATGGLAYGEIQSNGTLTVIAGTSVAASTSTINAGWTIGGGIEAALRDSWTARFEYLYIDFGSVGNAFTGIAPFTPITTNSRVTDNIVRFGLNYHFGGGPAVAKH
jgi:outer membrane immunogenic protein